MEELLKQTATQQRKALLNKEISAVDLINEEYKRIEAVDSTLGAFNSLCKEQAIETAKEVDKKIASGETLPPLAGIPLALKDNINMKDT